MANHAVVRTDRMFGTDNRGGLISIKYLGADGQTPTAIDNGNVLKVGALVDGEREVFVGSEPASTDSVGDIVLVASPEVMYDERLHNLDDFYNEAGKIARAYRLHSKDIFSVTADALSNATNVAVDDRIAIAADTKLAVAASGGIGRVIAIDVVGRYTYIVIEID